MPVDRWSSAQVLALAPDASSAKAARGLGGAGSWQATGLDDEVLWGLCRGSGKNPYQVCVDLSGPAYRCSCPSRKLPCKHALGLLLVWADGAGGAGPVPDWVAEWRESRAQRAAKASAPRSPGGPADPAGAAKRAAQREERVAGGVAELRRWLDDQVEQGLAAAERTGHRPFEMMAARLVDAQAPTAAAAVRRLGLVAGVGAHWTDRLASGLGMLRLLATAYERLDQLPPGLAATVRTRIGFPVSTDDVLGTPPVRDRWQVLGQVDSADDRLTTRRTWLRGAGTGRWALLLSFAAPGQPLAADVVPGTEVDADLCFYPGALPLRALVANRHASPVAVSSPAGAVGVDEAVAGAAAALSADPWRESVPVLLAGVVPTGDGHVVDATGDALPLTPGQDEPWWLLAAAGSRPVTLVGELSPAGLRPLAAWSEDRYRPAPPDTPAAGPHPVAELPAELLSAALVGTSRRPWTESTVRVAGRPLAVGGDGTAAALLEAIAVAVTYHRAGARPRTGHLPVTAAPAEVGRQVGTAAAARLELLLSDSGLPGGNELRQQLLAEWLGRADGAGRLAPPEALPDLLDAGRRSTAIRPVLARVAGARGRWLAQLRADWGYLLDEVTATAAGDWETGSPGERLAHLLQLRRADPAAGRDLLVAGFAAESAEDRTRFVRALATGLGPDDEEFLERAVDDRRREVREAARELLRQLPGSGLRRRAGERALACVGLEHRRLGRDRLVLRPPAECDTGMRRDGVSPQPPHGIGVGAWLLEELVAGAPLETWTSAFGRSAEQLLALPVADDWAAVLHRGWVRAAATERESRWAEALVDVVDFSARQRVDHRHDGHLWELYEALPPARLARLAADALRGDPGRANRLLAMYPDAWPDGLAAAVADAIEARAHSDEHTWATSELCRLAGAAMPPALAGRMYRLADRAAGGGVDAARIRWVAQLAEVLAFRSEMHKEFA